MVNNTSIVELYEKWKGKEVSNGGLKGIVCGYSDTLLIIALLNDFEFEFGWHEIDKYDHIITHQNNTLGYFCVSPKQLENNEQ